jgi:prophage regulatory protein
MIRNKVIRLAAVREVTGLGRTTLYRNVRDGKFPRPVLLGARAVGWIEADVQAWLTGRIEASTGSAL